MSIQPAANASAWTESRTSAARQAAPSGSSFQDLLTAQSAQAAQAPASPSRTGDSVDARLAELDTLILNRMRASTEKNQEQKEWEHILACLDAWIESLREEGDIGKIVRAHAKVLEDEVNQVSPKRGIDDYLLEVTEQIL